MPTTIRRSDETERGGSRSTAEDIRVVSRIDPAQTARDHGPAKLAAVTAAVHIIRDRRGSAEKAQGGGDGKHDDSFSADGKPPVVRT